MQCIICKSKLTGKQEKYCSHACENKGWKINNREKYLLSKKKYRENNKEKILKYKKYFKRKGIPHSTRKDILKIRKNCERCGLDFRLNVHHIKPLRVGGGHEENNLLLLCWDCHMLWHKLLKGFWV